MFNRIKKITKKIKDLSTSIDNYKQESIIQSLPTVAYVNKAKKQIAKKHYDQAETILLEALDISQQDSLVYKYLGKIYEYRYFYERAVEYYQNSARLNPHDKEIWIRLGMCQLNIKQYDEAMDSFEKADKVTPMNTDVQTGMGMALMRMKKYALARDKFVLASQISKYNYTAILLSAVMETRLCNYDSAETKLNFLNKVAPNESSAYEYANLKLLKSDYKASEIYAKKALDYNKKMLPAYFILGEIYSIQKDFDKVEKIFNKAVHNELDCDNLQFHWGKACVRLFDFENAQIHFEKSLEYNSEFLDGKIGLALVKALNNEFELLNELKEKYGNNVYIQESIGLYYMKSDRLEDATEMFKKALRTDKSQTYNYLHLARTYQRLGNDSKVRENFEKFVTENPKYLQGYIEYAKWLIEKPDFAEAQRKLRKAQRLSHKNIEILNLLFYCSYRLVKENLCEYNIKETLSIAKTIEGIGRFEYTPEKAELEDILKNIQGH